MRLLIMFILVSLYGCGPAKVLPIITIKPNETAFLVPLEKQTKEKQNAFMSLDFLKQAKVATKRIVVPVRKRSTGRMWFSYEWIPLMGVIVVDRTPVTREWTPDATTGTSTSNEGIEVESLDSIGFQLGVNITAMVTEEDASLFLYSYATKKLSAVVDEDVRGKVLSILSREFGSRTLDRCKKDKAHIFELARKEVRTHFKQFGVTISNLGHSRGLTYVDKEIQKSINDAYISEMKIKEEENKSAAQEKINARNISQAKAEAQAAREFEKAKLARTAMVKLEIERLKAKAQYNWSQKWDGRLPEKVLPSNSNLLLNFK